MTPAITGLIIGISLIVPAGTGTAIKCYLNPRQENATNEVKVEHNLENVIGDIIEDHIQRNSEDSDTEIKINIHTHHKQKE